MTILQASNLADSGRMTPQAVARRQKIAEAMMGNSMKARPIQHWAQGLAQMGEAAVGGYILNQIDQAEKANAADSAKAIKDSWSAALPGQSSSLAPTPNPLPNSPATPMANRGVQIIDDADNKPSPLDPPSGADRDKAIRTVVAEAGNQGANGMNAVASVIRNRAVNTGATPSAVVTAPNQFEPWNTQAGRDKMAALDPNSPAYKNAATAVDAAYFGSDPTNGATQFYAPKAQAALGRSAPAWDNGRGVDIGDHRFFGGANGPTEMSAQSRPKEAPVAAALAGAAPVPQNTTTDKIAAMLASGSGARVVWRFNSGPEWPRL